MSYIVSFRRNRHEAYWKTHQLRDLYAFTELLKKMFEETTETELEIVIVDLSKKK